jgi:pimeloyl-ACP methyl ester carboxylesterase
MKRYRTAPVLLALLILLFVRASSVLAQGSELWQDPSPHRSRFVPVEPDVKLEVLDWGGTGRDIVLLAGLGNTAHVFDEFAPKLIKGYHVWGITRRGFGASSRPASGYSADRLADDVIAVIDALKLTKPVLAGHSIAGEELSSIGTRHPEKVSALIYMEAAHPYAFYDRAHGDFLIDTLDLRRKLGQLLPGEQAGGDLKNLVNELLDKDLPQFQRTLQRTRTIFNSGPPPMMPQPTANDRASFTAYGAWHVRVLGIAVPESELRQQFASTATGGVGEPHMETTATDAVMAGQRRYTDVQVPVLAIFANGGPQADFVERAVRSAQVVRIPNAQHAIFLSNQTAVVDAMRSFLTKAK